MLLDSKQEAISLDISLFTKSDVSVLLKMVFLMPKSNDEGI